MWSAVELRKLEPGFSTVGLAANRQREEQETLCKRGSNTTKAETDASAENKSTSAEEQKYKET